MTKEKKSAYMFSKYLLRLISKESDSNSLSSEEHLKKIKIKYIIIIILVIITVINIIIIRAQIYIKR